jgi:hypothetical protein
VAIPHAASVEAVEGDIDALRMWVGHQGGENVPSKGYNVAGEGGGGSAPLWRATTFSWKGCQWQEGNKTTRLCHQRVSEVEVPENINTPVNSSTAGSAGSNDHWQQMIDYRMKQRQHLRESRSR